MKRKILAASAAIAVFMAGVMVGVAGEPEPEQVLVTEEVIVTEEVEVEVAAEMPEECASVFSDMSLASQTMGDAVYAIDETARILSGAGESEQDGVDVGTRLMTERDNLELYSNILNDVREQCEEEL